MLSIFVANFAYFVFTLAMAGFLATYFQELTREQAREVDETGLIRPE